MPKFDVLNEITNTCIIWCQQMYDNHQQNIIADNMLPLILALASLFICYLTLTYDDFIMKYFNMSEKYLHLLNTSSFYFALYLLAIYVVYLAFFV